MSFFEGLLTLPHTTDLYQIHQQVWQKLYPGAEGQTRDFIFLRKPLPDGQLGVFFRTRTAPQVPHRVVAAAPLQAGEHCTLFVYWYPLAGNQGHRDRSRPAPAEHCLARPARYGDIRRRLEINGFEVNDVQLGNSEQLPVQKKGRPGFQLIGQSAFVDVSVADLEKARAVWVSGLGKKKSFGFGYLAKVAQ